MNIKESNLKKWTGSYNGVGFEINNWKNDSDGKENWTFYLILFLSRIPIEHKPNSYWLKGKKSYGHIIYDYYKHHVLSNIIWHCGITYYSKENGFDGDEKVIKVGCDYRHYWDEGHYYNLEIVKFDVKKAIESFLEFVPNYKYWCCGNGKLYDGNEGVIKEGRFFSKEYFGDNDWFKELYKKIEVL